MRAQARSLRLDVRRSKILRGAFGVFGCRNASQDDVAVRARHHIEGALLLHQIQKRTSEQQLKTCFLGDRCQDFRFRVSQEVNDQIPPLMRRCWREQSLPAIEPGLRWLKNHRAGGCQPLPTNNRRENWMLNKSVAGIIAASLFAVSAPVALAQVCEACELVAVGLLISVRLKMLVKSART